MRSAQPSGRKFREAGSVTQHLLGGLDGVAVGSEDGAGESVRRGLVAKLEGLLVLCIGIYINGDDGSEDLLADGLVVGRVGHDDGGLYEVTDALVALATEHDLSVFAGFCSVDIALAVVERSLIDHSVDVVGEVCHIAHLDGAEHVADNLFHLFPHRLRDISA